MNVLVLVPYLPDTAPGQRFRIEQWARALERQGVRFHFAPFETDDLRAVIRANGRHGAKAVELLRCMERRVRFLLQVGPEWDVIVIHRELAPIGPPVLERALAAKGIPIVYDFDDAIFLPDMSDANRAFKWLKWARKTGVICGLSSHVMVGNRYLQEYALAHTDRVSIVPTTIDTDAYTMKPDVDIPKTPVVGWSGSLTTLKHLRHVEPMLQALARTVRFTLKVVGSPDVSMGGIAVESKAWSARSEIDDLRSFDVGIMPLPDDPWSRGKCGLKALQYLAVGVPTVVSPVGVNREIIEDGTNGFVAATERQWVEKLTLLLADRALRARVAREGRRTVEERYSAAAHVPRVLEILQAASERRRSAPVWRLRWRSQRLVASSDRGHVVAPSDTIGRDERRGGA